VAVPSACSQAVLSLVTQIETDVDAALKIGSGGEQVDGSGFDNAGDVAAADVN